MSANRKYTALSRARTAEILFWGKADLSEYDDEVEKDVLPNIKQAIKSRDSNWRFEYLGCDWSKLFDRLGKQCAKQDLVFAEYGTSWEIDHKRSVKDFHSFPELLHYYKNLQALPKAENRKKGARSQH